MFVLPNMTWLSPFGFAQQMISASFQPNLVHVIDGSWNITLDILAVRSDENATIVFRVVNMDDAAAASTIQVLGIQCAGRSSVQVSELYSDDGNLTAVNPPSEPTKISPRVGDSAEILDGTLHYTFKPSSFTTMTVKCDS